MAREEVKSYIDDYEPVYPNAVKDIIDDIYDDFESRTCENCKYYFIHMLKADEMQCKNHNSFTHQSAVIKSDGCNKHERKDG